MDSIWNYMLGEVHRQSGLEGRTIKLTSLVQDPREGTKSDSGEIDMEVERVTQYVVTKEEFEQIMSALRQESRDYIFYQEWSASGAKQGRNTIAYDAGSGKLVIVIHGETVRNYSGGIMVAFPLSGALMMMTNSATWAMGRRMDWQYTSDQSAEIYKRLGCNRMDIFCTTEGDFENIE